MLQIMDDLPDKVLGCRAEGRVTAEDYREVLAPALERKLERHDRVNFLYHLGPSFTRFTTTALWDDARLGFHHLQDFRRVAVVTDVDWLKPMVTAAAKLADAELRLFSNDELEKARAWLSD